MTTQRDGDQLVVTYRVEQDRELRYTYSSSANPSRLIVDVQFLERGAGDKARRVYEPGVETAAPSPPTAAAPHPRHPGGLGPDRQRRRLSISGRAPS